MWCKAQKSSPSLVSSWGASLILVHPGHRLMPETLYNCRVQASVKEPRGEGAVRHDILQQGTHPTTSSKGLREQGFLPCCINTHTHNCLAPMNSSDW